VCGLQKSDAMHEFLMHHVRVVLPCVTLVVHHVHVACRLQNVDAMENGWVLDSLVENKQEAQTLASLGVMPKHCGRCILSPFFCTSKHTTPSFLSLNCQIGHLFCTFLKSSNVFPFHFFCCLFCRSFFSSEVTNYFLHKFILSCILFVNT